MTRSSPRAGRSSAARSVPARPARRPGRACRAPGDPLPGRHAGRVRGVPPRASTTSSRSRPPKKGSGPAFNGTSCAACHNVPAVGGIEHDRRGARRAARTRRRASSALDAAGETLFHLFSVPGHGCQPVDPGRGQRHRAPRADSAVRRRPGRSDSRRRRILALEDPSDRNRDGVSGRARASSTIAAPASGASAASAGRRSTRRCSRSAPTPTATRWASPTTSSRTELAVGVDGRADARCAIRFPTRRTSAIRARGAAASTTSPASCASWRRSARGRSTRRRAPASSVFARHRLRHLPRAGADDRAERATRCSIASRCRSSPICCCTTSAPATASCRASAEPERDPHAGAVGAAVPPAAAARRHRRRRSKTRFAGTRGEAELARRGFEQLTDADRAALLAFLRSL